MIKWTEKAVDAAIKGWFGMWATDETRMLNALNAASKEQDVGDITMLLAWEDGYNAAVEDALKIARETEDPYDMGDRYCQGVCDAAYGIARDIKNLKKV